MHSGITIGERAMAEKLVDVLLAKGLNVTVFDDGDEPALAKSTDKAAILANIGETFDNALVLRDASDIRLGFLFLVWGNADDGSELLSDYTMSKVCEEIAAEVWQFSVGA